MNYKILTTFFLLIFLTTVNAIKIYNGLTPGWTSHEVASLPRSSVLNGPAAFGLNYDVEFEPDTKIIHIMERNSNKINYIYWDGTQFKRELVMKYDYFGLLQRNVYLELDPDRNPVIFFKDHFITDGIIMAKRVNGTWQVSNIGGKKEIDLGSHGIFSNGNIRIAPNGHIVNLSYFGCTTFCDKKMVFFEYDGTTWKEEIVEDINPYNYAISPPRVAFDSAGNPQAVYLVNESPNGCAQFNWRYAKRVNNVWHVERIKVDKLINCKENIKGTPYVMDGDKKEVFTFAWGAPYTRIYKKGNSWKMTGPGPSSGHDPTVSQTPIKLPSGGYAFAKTQSVRYNTGVLEGDTFLSLYNEDPNGFSGKIEEYHYPGLPPVEGTGRTMTFMADDGQFVIAYNLEGKFSIATNGPLFAPPTPNNPPVLNPIGDKQVIVGEKLEFSVTATDPDGDTLTFSANNLPDGASFNPITKTFTWIPRANQTGSHTGIEFNVSDSKDTAKELITITVLMKPTADFKAIPRSGVTPLIVDFDASISTDDTKITSYDWDFGDGSYGTGITQQKTYSTANPVNVSLTVTDEDGLFDTITKQVVPISFESITSLEVKGNSTNNPILVRVKCTKDLQTTVELWKMNGASQIALTGSTTAKCNDSAFVELTKVSEPGSYQIIAKLNIAKNKCSRCEIKQFLTIANNLNISVPDSNPFTILITLIFVITIIHLKKQTKKNKGGLI